MANKLCPKTRVTGQISCAECGGKMSPANSHSRCVRCTRCSPDRRCDICRLWSDDRWAQVVGIEKLEWTDKKTDSGEQPKPEEKTDSVEQPKPEEKTDSVEQPKLEETESVEQPKLEKTDSVEQPKPKEKTERTARSEQSRASSQMPGDSDRRRHSDEKIKRPYASLSVNTRGRSWLSYEAGEPSEQLGLDVHKPTVVRNIRPFVYNPNPPPPRPPEA